MRGAQAGVTGAATGGVDLGRRQPQSTVFIPLEPTLEPTPILKKQTNVCHFNLGREFVTCIQLHFIEPTDISPVCSTSIRCGDVINLFLSR